MQENENCPLCTKHVAKDGVQCDLCEYWHHRQCVNMSKETLKVLSKSSTDTNCGVIHWICSGCQRGAKKIMAVITQLSNAQAEQGQKIQKLENQIEELRSKAHAADKRTEEDDTRQLSLKGDMVKEMDDRMRREKNIIVFGLDESSHPQLQQQRKDDAERLGDAILDALGSTVDMSNNKRLGKKQNDAEQSRPLLVSLKNWADKNVILDNRNKLYSTKKLSAKKDQTPYERKVWKDLIIERNAKRESCRNEEEKKKWKIRDMKVVFVE